MTQSPPPIRLLIVDDEPELREMLVDLFAANGFAVTCAKNGAEALKLCLATTYDFILTDERMPGGNGMEFIVALSAQRPFLPPIALMTGHHEVELAEVQKLGILEIFQKPFKIKDVSAFVRAHVEKNRLKPPSEL